MEAKIIELEKWKKLSWNLAQKLVDEFQKGWGYALTHRDGNKRINLLNEEDRLGFIGFLTAAMDQHMEELVK